MAVIDTNKWLEDYAGNKGTSRLENRLQQEKSISKKLISYFKNTASYDIHDHLLQHGLFSPSSEDEEIITSLKSNHCWRIVKEELIRLRKVWNGPDVPVFIFPSDTRNQQLKRDFNGLSGLSYRDKVFLFVSEHATKAELCALLTHEYNHVCRLDYLDKRESSIELLDSICLEGLAEMAVQERLGREQLAKWAQVYSLDTALNHWDKWIKPNINIMKKERRHDELLYGRGFIPKWLGYNAGFHLVSSYMKNKERHIKAALHVSAETILEGSDFPA